MGGPAAEAIAAEPAKQVTHLQRERVLDRPKRMTSRRRVLSHQIDTRASVSTVFRIAPEKSHERGTRSPRFRLNVAGRWRALGTTRQVPPRRRIPPVNAKSTLAVRCFD